MFYNATNKHTYSTYNSQVLATAAAANGWTSNEFPGFQQWKRAGRIVSAVGMITSPVQAEHIIRTEQADAVIMAREFLRDPYWALRAARELDQPIAWPVQYLRAAPKGAQPRVPVDLKSFESCFEEQHAIPEQ